MFVVVAMGKVGMCVAKTAATRVMARQTGKARHRQLIVAAKDDNERRLKLCVFLKTALCVGSLPSLHTPWASFHRGY